MFLFYISENKFYFISCFLNLHYSINKGLFAFYFIRLIIKKKIMKNITLQSGNDLVECRSIISSLPVIFLLLPRLMYRLP